MITDDMKSSRIARASRRATNLFTTPSSLAAAAGAWPAAAVLRFPRLLRRQSIQTSLYSGYSIVWVGRHPCTFLLKTQMSLRVTRLTARPAL